jgi:hypothetical protein
MCCTVHQRFTGYRSSAKRPVQGGMTTIERLSEFFFTVVIFFWNFKSASIVCLTRCSSDTSMGANTISSLV